MAEVKLEITENCKIAFDGINCSAFIKGDKPILTKEQANRMVELKLGAVIKEIPSKKEKEKKVVSDKETKIVKATDKK